MSQVVVCPSCNEKNNPTFKSCWKCSGSLNTQANAKLQSDADKGEIYQEIESGAMRTAVAMKKCPFCAEEILVEAKKCKHCGEWLNRKSTEKTQTIELTSKKYKVQRIYSIIVMIVGFLILVVAYANSSTGSPVLGLCWFGLTVLLVGLLCWLWAGFLTWWHHE